MISPTAAIVLALSLASVAVIPEAGAADEAPVPVIISTDPSTGLDGGWWSGPGDIDDGLAIAMAVASHRLDVRGVVVTFGNALVEPSFAVAQRVVDGMGSTISVFRGAARPLPEFPMTLYDGSKLDSACLNQGVRFMADELRSAQTPVTILAIGPLTDLACLAMNLPDAADRIEWAVVIGGRNAHQPFEIAGTRFGDFNLIVDMPAVKYLLTETAILIRFMPFGLTSSVLIPAADRAVVCQSALPLVAEFFCPAIVPWLEAW
ncbi:MAG: hypothetical protein GY798_26405 [Hyphomicrobiales bacterium]|nr:hypothetical protein [Hyphomicrobiales bacterium]